MVDQDREIRVMGLEGLEIRAMGKSTNAFVLRGYAAVYDQTSHDLGGFREQIAQGAFDEVLATNPDVHLTWDHDTRYVAVRTRPMVKSILCFFLDIYGLFIDAEVGNYSWAKDFWVVLERGDIDQGSFAFHVAPDGDEFASDDDGNVMRTIRNVGALYDVTVTAQGAYPQTSLAAVRSLAKVTGRPPEEVEAALVAENEAAKAEAEGGGDESEQERSVEDDEEFARWYAAMEMKSAVRKAILVKVQERLEKF